MRGEGERKGQRRMLVASDEARRCSCVVACHRRRSFQRTPMGNFGNKNQHLIEMGSSYYEKMLVKDHEGGEVKW